MDCTQEKHGLYYYTPNLIIAATQKDIIFAENYHICNHEDKERI